MTLLVKKLPTKREIKGVWEWGYKPVIPTPGKLTQATVRSTAKNPTEQNQTRRRRARPQPLTGARGRDVSAPRVRQHLAVADNAHADLVGATFEPQHRGHGAPRLGIVGLRD